MLTPREKADLIKAKAHQLGFLACGIARAGFLEEEAPRLEKWLREGRHGEMGYMERNFDMRLDPRLIVEGAKSVISLAYNYYTLPKQIDPEAPKISTYAYGRDYHKVIKKRLKPLIEMITGNFGHVDLRVFVDSAPVLEKAWAQRAGVGWQGKHTNINLKPDRSQPPASSLQPPTSSLQPPTGGSFFFLCEIILDLDLDPDPPATDHCGTCRRCIDACPTDAITPYGVDGSKCISYFTIELKGEIPDLVSGKWMDWVFGCDICQQVCPWNRFSKPHKEPQFDPKPELMGLSKDEWYGMTELVFDRLFEGSAVKRTKFDGLKRNLRFISGQKKTGP